MPTISDVARHAGVSPSTVSYVLSGARPISYDTRVRVRQSIEALGYRPHAGARSLRSNKTGIIALVVPFRSYVFRELTDDAQEHEAMACVEAVLRAARNHHMNVLLLIAEEGTGEIERVVDSSMVDGLIFMQIGLHDNRIPFMKQLPRPVVLIGMPEDPEGLIYVEFDFAEAGRLCATHLADLGHRSIAFLGHLPVSYDSEEAFAMRARRGAAEALEERGLSLPTVPCEPTPEGVAKALESLFTGGRGDPTALIVHNEIGLHLVEPALASSGRMIGRDVSVVTICPDELATRVAPPLTNVGIPDHYLGTKAVDLLVTCLEDGGLPQSTLLAPRLTRRGSDFPAKASQRPRKEVAAESGSS